MPLPTRPRRYFVTPHYLFILAFVDCLQRGSSRVTQQEDLLFAISLHTFFVSFYDGLHLRLPARARLYVNLCVSRFLSHSLSFHGAFQEHTGSTPNYQQTQPFSYSCLRGEKRREHEYERRDYFVLFIRRRLV